MPSRLYAPGPFYRVLFGAIFTCSLGFSAAGQTPRQKEARAIAAIQKAVGTVVKDAKGKAVDISVFGDTGVVFGDTGVDLASIDFSVFSHVESLTVSNVETKNKLPLAPFLGLPPGLWFLRIMDGDIDDEQLGQLVQKHRKSLKALYLTRTTLSDRSLEKIGKLEGLYKLELERTKVTDKGLKSLVDLHDLAVLNLSNTNISDRGLKNLENLQLLFALNLSNTDISDAGLVEIKKLSNLGMLNLRGTKVTDAGILQLAEIELLHSLNVSETKVTEKGKKALKELLPDLKLTK